jgi:hypothetical protein
MASNGITKSSSPAAEPIDLDAGLPTTAADVAALRQLRERPVPNLLEHIGDLDGARWLPAPPRRRTHAGRPPFEL